MTSRTRVRAAATVTRARPWGIAVAAAAADTRARLLCGGVVIAAALLLASPGSSARQSPFTDHRFHSAALGREMTYRVLMPADAGAAEGRGAAGAGRASAAGAAASGSGGSAGMPVLYLLHGLDGTYSDWSTRTRIAEHAAASGLLVVMPDGANSWYVNWHDGASEGARERAQPRQRERWEDYLARDLVAEVDARFPTDARRDGRFIAGFSMGGYGALRMGLKHPGQYAVAASLSGALDAAERETYGWTNALRAEFVRAFGPPGSERRREDDLLALAARVDPRGLPFLYVDCGTADPFLPANRRFVATLHERGIPYEYRETPGRHDWPYWDRQIVEVLRLIASR